MQNEKHLMEIATQFIRVAEEHLEKMKKTYNMDFVVLYLSEEEFYDTFEAIEFIRKLGKEKNIHIEINDEESSYKEFATPWCFCIKKFNNAP